MKIIERIFHDCLVIELNKYSDDRGFFYESYNTNDFNSLLGNEITFVQDNQSLSSKNVFRGVHFQLNPKAQGKLVQALSGKVIDFIVDLRKNSDSFLSFAQVELLGNDSKMIWIPKGFGHAFLSLEDNSILSYKVTEYYSKDHDRTLKHDKIFSSISSLLPTKKLILSQKDKSGMSLKEINLNELF